VQQNEQLIGTDTILQVLSTRCVLIGRALCSNSQSEPPLIQARH